MGIAFGGGGLRGFVHLGVIRALREANLQADVVTGASAGAIAAVFYGANLPTSFLTAAAAELGPLDLADPVLSTQGLLQGRKLAQWINQTLPQNQLEQLTIPVGVVVTDLIQQQLLLLQEGNAGQAVQASSSIPGTFVPVLVNDQVWVDGGVLSVVPVRFARAMGAERVLAIDVFCGRGYPPKLNAFWTTTQAFRLQICQSNAAELAEADWILRPDFEPDNFLSFSERERAIESGYQAMKALLPQIQQDLQLNQN